MSCLSPRRRAASPFSVYGQSKLAAEGYVGFYARAAGLPATTLRLGNVYGPRQDPATEAGVVAIFSRRAATADALRCSARASRRGTTSTSRTSSRRCSRRRRADEPGPLNVGTGIETSVLELVELVGMALRAR